MTEYRKSPETVEAEKASDLLHNAQHDWSALPAWVVELYDSGDIVFAKGKIHINLDLHLTARDDDYVVRNELCGVTVVPKEKFDKYFTKVK